jgi:hypothetical protein
MFVSPASVSVFMALSFPGALPPAPRVEPLGAATPRVRLAAVKLWAPKKPKAKTEEDYAKEEEMLLKLPHVTKAPQITRSALPARPAPAANASTRRGVKFEEAANDDARANDGQEDDDGEVATVRKRKRVFEDDDEVEVEPLPSLPVVRPRLVAFEVGPAMIVRTLHYDAALQGESHTRLGYQLALESFPFLNTTPGFLRLIGIGASFEAESGNAGIIQGNGATRSYPVGMYRWGADLRYALPFGPRWVVVPAVGYGRASANLQDLPASMVVTPSACTTSTSYPCFASANPSYVSIDVNVRAAVLPALSVSFAVGYFAGIGVASGVGQISSSEATATVGGYHIDLGGSLLAYGDWLAVTAQIPIRQYNYSFTPTAGSAATYRSATDTNYGFVVGVAALVP